MIRRQREQVPRPRRAVGEVAHVVGLRTRVAGRDRRAAQMVAVQVEECPVLPHRDVLAGELVGAHGRAPLPGGRQHLAAGDRYHDLVVRADEARDFGRGRLAHARAVRGVAVRRGLAIN